MKKEEIIRELRRIAKEKGKSPTRREVRHLNYHCINKFGSFNKAKKESNLRLYNVRHEKLPKKAYKIDKDLAGLISFLTFDGHVYGSLKGLALYSKDKKPLKKYEKLIKNKIGLIGTYKEGNGYGGCTHYRIFNKKFCEFLNKLGTPKGDKMLIPFDIPKWIKDNKEFSREYLKVAYFCEGCKYQHSKNRESIQFNLNKSEELLEDGLNFMESLKDLLKNFGIETTKTWILFGNLRKRDGKITKMMKFKVKANSINRFIKEIGWIK